MTRFSDNQIVKGKIAGTFVVLGHYQDGHDTMYVLKAVNPDNHAETAAGELHLPEHCLTEII